MSIRDRIFVFGGPQSLNERLRVVILAPIFIIIGISLRYILFPPSDGLESVDYLLNIIFPIGAMYLGFFLLKLID